MRSRETTCHSQREEFVALNAEGPAAKARRHALLEWLVQRRPEARPTAPGQYRPGTGCDCSCEPGLPPVAVIDWHGEGDGLPVVAGECLVRVDPDRIAEFDQLKRRLKSMGWSTQDEAREGEPTIVKFTTGGDADLELALRVIEEQGWRGGPNHIIPLNWSVKGKIGPEATCETLPPLDADCSSGPKLQIIDTGLASTADRYRTDGRLATAKGDLDPLDEVDRNGYLIPDGCLDLGAGHGTSVAGVAECVEPELDVNVHRALGPDGVGTEEAIAKLIFEVGESARKHGGGVINLSFGTQSYDDKAPLLLESAFEKLGLGDAEARARSQLCIVAAAGNWGDDGRPSWPAALPGAIAVAGLDEAGGAAVWSTRGEWVEFSAQAECIVAPYVVGKETPGTNDPGDPYDVYPDRWDGPNPNALWLGTSFAAPQVAARLARYVHEAPGITCGEAVARLEDAGEKRHDGFGVSLWGLLSKCAGGQTGS